MKTLLLLMTSLIVGAEPTSLADRIIINQNRFAKAYTTNVAEWNNASTEFVNQFNKWTAIKQNTVAVKGRGEQERAEWKVLVEKWAAVDKASREWIEVGSKWDALRGSVESE